MVQKNLNRVLSNITKENLLGNFDSKENKIRNNLNKKLSIDNMVLRNKDYKDDEFIKIKYFINTVNMKNIQPYVYNNDIILTYAYILYLFNGNSKKANKLLMRLLRLNFVNNVGERTEHINDIPINVFKMNSFNDRSDLFFDEYNFLDKILRHDMLEDINLDKEKAILFIFDLMKNNKVKEVKNINWRKVYSKDYNFVDTVKRSFLRYKHDDDSIIRLINNRFIRFISDFDPVLLTQLLDMLLVRNDIDLHDFLETLSTGFFKRITGDYKYQDFVVKFVRRIKDVNLNDFTKILEFMNYKRVHKANNISIMGDQIDFIMNAKLSNTNSDFKGLTEEVESGMLFYEKLDKPKMKVNGREEILFTKTFNKIVTIGSRTRCCFKIGGLADSLVKVAIKSPLAGIIEGKMKGTRDEWFSFVWEMVEAEKETGLFRSTLILDNLESSGIISESDLEYYINFIHDNSSYEQIYLGTLRNDISLDINHCEKIKRPSKLINYEKYFDRYSYDDSQYIVDVNEIYGLQKRKIDDITVSTIKNDGMFHRVQAVEKIIWEGDYDFDLNKINYNYSPSYAIMGNDNVILGYLITRLISRDKTTKKINFSYIKEEELKEIIEDDNLELVLLFEDIYMSNNRRVILSAKNILTDITKFIKDNKIKYTSASTNKFSKPLVKRLSKISKYIEDERQGLTYLNNGKISITEDGKSHKVSDDIFTEEVEVNTSFKEISLNKIYNEIIERKNKKKDNEEEKLFSYSYDD